MQPLIRTICHINPNYVCAFEPSLRHTKLTQNREVRISIKTRFFEGRGGLLFGNIYT